MPFTIVKKAGREDRFTFLDTPVDDYLDTQALRDVYFQLSGQSFKVGQASCAAFPRKGDLIHECHRLIAAYIATPKLWETTLASQEKKRADREKREAKKAAAAAALQARIDARVLELAALSNEEFDILQAAMAKVIRTSATASDSE